MTVKLFEVTDVPNVFLLSCLHVKSKDLSHGYLTEDVLSVSNIQYDVVLSLNRVGSLSLSHKRHNKLIN